MFIGFKSFRSSTTEGQSRRRKRAYAVTTAAPIDIPRLPLSAILGFAVLGFGGAFFLAYSRFQPADSTGFQRTPSPRPVYSARAVPRDSERLVIAEPHVALTQHSQAATAPEQRESGESRVADSIFASSDREQPLDINGFSHFSAPNSYLAVAAQTAIGISAQTNSAGHFAPSAETEIVAPVPEPSTWLAGIALALLVGVRCVRSKWRRRQQRTE